jgi:hypothetical protein
MSGWKPRWARLPRRWGSLSQIDKNWIAGLRSSYPTQEAMQALLDEGEKVSALDTMAKSPPALQPVHYAEILAASLKRSASPLTGGWFSAHWADLATIAVVSLLFMLPTLGRMTERQRGVGDGPRTVAARDLLPYHPLAIDDVKAVSPSPEAAKALVAALAGRYPVRLIKAGQTIDSDWLSTGTFPLGNVAILRVALKLKPAVESRSFPSAATLVLSARDVTPPGGEAFPIEVLHLDPDALGGVIAIGEGRAPELGKWLGSSDAFLIFSLSGGEKPREGQGRAK